MSLSHRQCHFEFVNVFLCTLYFGLGCATALYKSPYYYYIPNHTFYTSRSSPYVPDLRHQASCSTPQVPVLRFHIKHSKTKQRLNQSATKCIYQSMIHASVSTFFTSTFAFSPHPRFSVQKGVESTSSRSWNRWLRQLDPAGHTAGWHSYIISRLMQSASGPQGLSMS